MSGLQFTLDGQPAIPKEWPALELQLNWATGAPSTSLSTSKFTFEGKDAHRVNDWVDTGVYGALVGIPFKIQDCNNLIALDGCADPTDAIYSCDSVEMPIRDNRIADYLTDRKDSFTFAYLASLPANTAGKISASDYVNIPYCISALPNYTQLLATAVTVFLITKEIAEAIRKTGDLAAEAAVPPVTIVAAVKLILQVAYLALILIALINLFNTLYNCIIQPVKYKKGMKVRTLCQRACAFIGVSFSSSILLSSTSKYYNSAIIPRKIIQPTSNYLGFKRPADESQNSSAYGYYDGTFGQLITELETIFNAKFIQRGNTVYFERVDFWNNQSSYTLPNIDLLGKNNMTYKLNASELPSNYFLQWSLDNTELNTYDHYEGTTCQMQAHVINYSSTKNILLTGLAEKTIGFALAKRKEILTPVEKVFNDIAALISFFTNQQPVTIRTGWLLLSSDYTSVPKFCILDSSNKIKNTNKADTSATYLMNTYHYISFPLNDQWIVYENVEVPFCCKDYVQLLNNNTIHTTDGRIGKLTSLKWQIGSDVAHMDFRIRPHNNRYTSNITQTIISDLQ